MNRYLCKDCGKYQYTAITEEEGCRCVHCGNYNVFLDTHGVPNEDKEKKDEAEISRTV